jgi:hypothetical protein
MFQELLVTQKRRYLELTKLRLGLGEPALNKGLLLSNSYLIRTLRLHLYVSGGAFCAHINNSTLPRLENLSIHGPFGSVAVYRSVAGLVHRSGCSLRQLALDPGDRDSTGSIARACQARNSSLGHTRFASLPKRSPL